MFTFNMCFYKKKTYGHIFLLLTTFTDENNINED